jgi:hypothetical protein
MPASQPRVCNLRSQKPAELKNAPIFTGTSAEKREGRERVREGEGGEEGEGGGGRGGSCWEGEAVPGRRRKG